LFSYADQVLPLAASWPHLVEAIAAIDWLVASRLERHLSFLATLGTYGWKHLAPGPGTFA